MGRLVRDTRRELQEPGWEAWWPEFYELVIKEGGGEAITAWCKKRFWSYGEFWRWIKASEQRHKDYDEARQLKAELEVGKVYEIADEADNSSKGAVDKARLRIETRLKMAEKWYPEVYRPRTEKEISVVVADAGLIGDAVALLSKIRQTAQPKDITDAVDSLQLQEAQQEAK